LNEVKSSAKACANEPTLKSKLGFGVEKPEAGRIDQDHPRPLGEPVEYRIVVLKRVGAVGEEYNRRTARTAFAHAEANRFGFDIADAGPR
jgi:hypothetical protein